MERDIKASSFKAGYFISGAVIGSAIALLFAPRAGKETREKVGDWLEEKRKRGASAMKEAVDSGGRTLRRVRREAGV